MIPEEVDEILRDIGLLLLRLAAGGMMLYGHGWGKFNSFGEKADKFPDPLGVGAPTSMALTIFAEFFCSIFMMLGLATRLAAIPLVVAMSVAAFIVHGDDPFGDKEMALLYASTFAALGLAGAGRVSLDAAIGFWRSD